MSRAVPHFITVQDGPGQLSRRYGCDSKAEALRDGERLARTGYVGGIVKVYKGEPRDGVEQDPVKVWS
jgi:hypothetical protein